MIAFARHRHTHIPSYYITFFVILCHRATGSLFRIYWIFFWSLLESYKYFNIISNLIIGDIFEPPSSQSKIHWFFFYSYLVFIFLSAPFEFRLICRFGTNSTFPSSVEILHLLFSFTFVCCYICLEI